MITIGLTGSFGTGKTFVAGLFKQLGAGVIDADRIAHRMLNPGAPAHVRCVRRFGAAVCGKGGAINRQALGRIVFGDPSNVKALNRIVHPYVIAEIKRQLQRMGRKKIVVIDAPLLLEAGLERLVDHIIVVTASRKTQLARCRKKFSMSQKEVVQRMRHQLPLAVKCARADFVIDNDGSRQATRNQVRKVWGRVWK